MYCKKKVHSLHVVIFYQNKQNDNVSACTVDSFHTLKSIKYTTL